MLGLVLLFHPMLWGGLVRVPGWPEQDPRLIAYVFEHAYRWLGGDPAHAELWSPPIFFPQKDVGQYTEPLFGLAPFYWPWRLAGFAPLASYQLWLATVCALNYLSALALLRWSLGATLPAATIGSFVFAFGSARIASLSKAHLVPSFYLVLATIALVELFRDPPRAGARVPAWGWVALFAAALVVQFNSAFYPFYFYGLALLLAALWTLCVPSLRRAAWPVVRGNAVAIVVCGALAVLAIAPLAARYVAAAGDVGFRTYDPTKITQWFSWLLTGSSNWLYGWLDDRPRFRPWSRSIHANGLGFLTMLLAAVGLWRARRRALVVVLVLVTLTMFVLTVRVYGDASLWRWVRVAVPGGEGLRAVARVGTLLAFPVAIGLALFFDQESRRGRTWLLVALAAVCVLEQVHRDLSFDRSFVDWRVARIAEIVPPGCRAFFLATTGGAGDPDVHDDAMWASLAVGVPTVNGRSGAVPPGWMLTDAHVAGEDERSDLRRRLAEWAAARGLAPGDVCSVELDRAREHAAWVARAAAGG